MKKRKSHSPDFKAKVAPEAIREEMTLTELSKKYGVHSSQIGSWKRAATENMATAYTRRGGAPELVSSADVDKLHSKIGQLVVERVFWPPLIHASMHCRAVDASHQLLGTRGKMVSKDHKLNLRRQCALLTFTRSNLCYKPKGESGLATV